jgi:uncharacterized protein (TIGR03437 family)
LAGLVEEDDAGKRSYRIQPLNAIDSVTVDTRGRVYFSLRQNSEVMMLASSDDLGPPPTISTGGVVTSSAFGGAQTIAPGTWIEIYGSDLAATTRSWSADDFQGSLAPTKLDDTSVSIGGKAAFVSYISPNQINVLVPSSVPIGTQQLTVTTRAGISASYSVTVAPVQPGIFAISTSSKQYAGALLTGGAMAFPANMVPGITSRPARAGENITIYGIGFGSVTPNIEAGVIASQADALDTPVTVLFGQTPATVTYAGLSPGSVGLYQLNVTVPAGLSGDAIPLTFSFGGTSIAQTLYTAVQR